MTLVIAAVLVGLIAAGAVIYPIAYGRWGLLGDPTSGTDPDLETKKRVALAALKEVEYDHASGKLDDNDYRQMKAQLEREALEAVRAARVDVRRLPSIVHECGFSNPGGSRFCAGCGRRLV